MTTETPERGETQIQCSRGLVDWLRQHNVSLGFTTYQSGDLFLLGALPDGRVSVHREQFTRAMGLAGDGDRIVVASVQQLWRLENMLGPGEQANEAYDRLYVPRAAQVTGDLDIHELAIDRAGRIVFVNTRFSCLAVPSMRYGFTPIWKPDFITKLAAEDRCHLNGLAMQNGVPRYVSCVGRSDMVDGWRAHRRWGGLVIDVETDAVVADNLSMPHSPRVLPDGRLLVLDSGHGELVSIDPSTGRRDTVTRLRGFARGLAIHNGFAVLTLSLPREGSFAGLDLDEALKSAGTTPVCAVQIVDLRSGDIVQWVELSGSLTELFDVCVLPGVACPMAVGLTAPELSTLTSFDSDWGPLYAG
jgi:uncharacterized protein (TIGR03032 family)